MRATYEPTLTEAQWQSQVVALARQCGWTQYHTFDSRRSAAGFPDIVLVKPPRILFWELKTERGKTTPDQEKWLGLLRACGLQAEVIRPSDREKVHRVLMGME